LKSNINANADAAANDVANDNGRVRHKFSGAFRGMAFEVPNGTDIVKQNLLNKLRKRADVEYVVPDYEVRALGSAGECR
jgi:hypothetical protein